MKKVGVIMNRNYLNATFYIRAIVRVINHDKAIYDVITNCGVQRFIPLDGDDLPKMVVNFMAENQEYLVHYATTGNEMIDVFYDSDII